MSDRDDLRRRAEVLDRVAEQLATQLRVERWSNAELRRLMGDPDPPHWPDGDGAGRRFLTFASVAVITAAAVALLVSRPWRLREVPEAASAVAEVGVALDPVAGDIVPFTVVVANGAAQPSGGAWGDAWLDDPANGGEADEILGHPAASVRLGPVDGARRGARLVFDAEETATITSAWR